MADNGTPSSPALSPVPTLYVALASLLLVLVLREVSHSSPSAPAAHLSQCLHGGPFSPPLAPPASLPTSFRYIRGGFGDADAPLEATVPSWVFSSAPWPGAGAPWPPTRAAEPPLPSVPQLREVQAFLSQDAEDAYAMEFYFAGKRGGVILESGALDGRMYSVSAGLAAYWGWRAVHVEASVNNYAGLVRNRPEALNIHAALCNSSGPLHWVSYDEVTSINGFWEMLSKEVKDKWFTHITPEVVAALPATTCRPLTPMLDMFGIRHIDLWVLDIEGSEYMALSTVDWARTEIDVISVEVLPPQTEEERAHEELVKTILTRAGYAAHSQQGRNTWWVRAGFVPSSCAANPALCEGAPEDGGFWRAMDAMVARDVAYQREHPGQHPQPVRRKRGDKRPPCSPDGCPWKEGE